MTDLELLEERAVAVAERLHARGVSTSVTIVRRGTREDGGLGRELTVSMPPTVAVQALELLDAFLDEHAEVMFAGSAQA